jgi:hypothetical protein
MLEKSSANSKRAKSVDMRIESEKDKDESSKSSSQMSF